MFSDTEELKCGVSGCEFDRPGLEACWPIPISYADRDFRHEKCLKFVRSQATPSLQCGFGPREQINQVTVWLDGSMVYGSTKEEAMRLRDLSNPGNDA